MRIRTGRPGSAALGAVLALAAVAAAGGCTPPAARPVPVPSRSAPTAQASTPPTSAAPVPNALPAGVYAYVATDSGFHLAVLGPGATSWRYAVPAPRPDIDQRYDGVMTQSFDLRWYLMFHRPDGSLWNISADGAEKHLIVTPPKGLEVCSAGYDQAADRIYYGLSTHFSLRFALYTVRPDGTDRRRVPGVTDAMSCSISWSADGSTIVTDYNEVPHPSVRMNHTLLVSDGTAMRELVVALPATVALHGVHGLSSDGRRAVVAASAVSSTEEVNAQLYLVDLRTGAAVRVVPPLRWSIPMGANALFDASGLMLTEMTTPTKDGGAQPEVGVFDQHGRFVEELPNPAIDNLNDINLWGVVR